MTTTEAALMTRGVSQLYLSLGDTNADGSIAVRLYYKPMVLLIWLGAVVMMLGGGLSLSDRRLRIGAPKPATKSGGETSAAAGGVGRMRAFALIALLAALVAPTFAFAVTPDEMLKDPALEARARDLSRELRCMVCQNQSIDDSEAPLAKDLRVLVRERLTKGDSDKQVLDFLVARYGEFVLLRPPFEWHTLLLWGVSPAALVGRHDRADRDRAAAQDRESTGASGAQRSGTAPDRLSTLVEPQPRTID